MQSVLIEIIKSTKFDHKTLTVRTIFDVRSHGDNKFELVLSAKSNSYLPRVPIVHSQAPKTHETAELSVRTAQSSIYNTAWSWCVYLHE